MRNFKRTLALVLAVLFVAGAFATVSAAETPWYQPGVDYIQAIGVDTISAAKAEQKITRNDFVLWIAKIESKQLLDSAWRDEIAGVDFSDVTDAHHKAAIAYSKQANFIIGNGDGTFAPDKATTLAEASAVIVRMMGYEDKVYDTSAENWAYNYMRAAQTYCHAFDAIFLAKTGTYNTDFELTYGQAAYLLASIMNYKEIDKELSLTADGIDLGSYFEANPNLGISENTYYVVDMTRLSETHVRANYTVNFETNLLDTNKDVVLAPVNGGALLTVDGETFLREVRLALGLPAVVDFMNEEEEIAVFANVSVGSMVNVVLDRSTGEIQSLGLVNQTNSVVVNTYVVANTLYPTKGVENFSNKYLGWHTNNIGDKQNLIVELPSSYNETLATSWTNIVKNANGEITSAVLNFKGVKYTVGTKNADIEVLDGNRIDPVTGKYAVLTADEAVNTLINAAQGSVYAVFNDTDDDGLYETVVVLKSDAFKIFSGVDNVDGADDTTPYPYITALTNGETVKDELGNEIKETAKYSAIGTVLFNYSVKFPNGEGLTKAWSNFCSDAWTNVGEATGKLQLAIAAEDGLGVLGGAGGANPMIHPIYKVVDLAVFETGIIEEVDAFTLANEGYYVAKIRLADDTLKTVYIPEVANTKATFDVTIGGATAEYTLDSSKWCTFLDQAKAAVDAGIVGIVDDAAIRYETAAWMAGKYVNFAVDAEGVIICILGTDKDTGINGFVVSADKTETGENTYNVTIAQSGTNVDYSYVYIKEVLASHFGSSPSSGKGHSYASGYQAGFLSMVEDANKPGTYVAKGGSFKTVDGVAYPVDSVGNFFIESRTAKFNTGVAALVTEEVRGNASSLTDWANYEVYQAIFAGKLIDPNFDYDKNDATTDDCRVNPGTDLIYVKLIQDGGSYYLQYQPYTDADIAATSSRGYTHNINGVSGFRSRWYYPTYNLSYSIAENSWTTMKSGHIIDIVKNEVIHEGLDAATGLVYEAYKYAAVVGYEPYYVRSYNSKTESYEYVIKYARVEILNDLVGVAEGIVDTKNTYMIPLYYGETGKESVQVKATTAEDKAKYTLANGFFVDDESYVFIIVSDIGIKWVVDKDGNYTYGATKYDWANATTLVVLTDVAFTEVADEVAAAVAALPENNDADTTNDFVIGEVDNVEKTYATVSFTSKVKGDEGYYPGAAYVNIDIEDADKALKYTVTSSTKVVLVTPSADGFTTTVYTVGEIINNKLTFFATEWNATVKNQANVGAIALLGTLSNVKLTEDAVVTPVKPSENRLVYLNASAKAVVKAAKYGKGWMVISDESAIELPSGEFVGQIYRVYSTYQDAKAASIDLTIKGGQYYMVDKNCEIVDDETGAISTDIKVGKLVSTNAAGVTTADMGDGKIVDVTNYDFQWFYRDTEGKLCKAGDSTNVVIIDGASYAKLFEKLEKNVANTKATLDVKKAAYDAGKLNQTKYDYYVAAYEAAVAELDAAKASNIDKYFNGQFWGFANSPYYTYVAMGAGSFQQDVSYLWFEYIQVGNTYCVFSDTFSVSDPNA